MSQMRVPTAIYYDDDGYVDSAPPEPRGRGRARRAAAAAGPIGRRVAGKEFLLAYLRYAQTDPLYALVRDRSLRQSVTAFCAQPGAELGSKKLEVLDCEEFHHVFFPKSPVSVIHYPSPIESRFAWARQYGGPTFALSGITHTISTTAVMVALCNMVTAPLEPFDAMVCISRAAIDSVRAVTDNYCAHLRERFGGGSPTFRPRLVNIPLGVDVAKYRPPTARERAEERRKYGIADDEVVVLYLGRLIYHGKVHPFPLYQGIVGASKATNTKVRLLMAGWSPEQNVLDVLKAGAKTFAPGITTTFVDGTTDDVRYRIWWAADVFAFPTDNIQETFPQSVIEAMACGLPVVAADWDGCRDQVIHGQTGFLVPTCTIPGATEDSTSMLLVRELPYDQFLGRCNQAVAVDLYETAQALAILFSQPEVRSRMGRAGRERAVSEFSWEKIVSRYEALWAEQELQRQEYLKAGGDAPRAPAGSVSPAQFPPPEHSFRSYPSRIAGAEMKFQAGPDAKRRIVACMKHQLTGYSMRFRCRDPRILAGAIAAASSAATLAELERVFSQAGVDPITARATIAWMIKYGILERRDG
jgi:glycosyltransferase involved in cell wall biosynthesis